VSEEVVLVDFVDAGPMFVLKLDSCMAVLDEDNARGLYNELREFLGMDKENAVTIGITFPQGCGEPDLPIGTKLLDDEGDTLQRVEGGWEWHTVGGEHPWFGDVYPWSTVSNEHSFTVIA
jgi:hypothetical protein